MKLLRRLCRHYDWHLDKRQGSRRGWEQTITVTICVKYIRKRALLINGLTHIAFDDIDKLWQFINRKTPDDFPHFSDTRVIFDFESVASLLILLHPYA